MLFRYSLLSWQISLSNEYHVAGLATMIHAGILKIAMRMSKCGKVSFSIVVVVAPGAEVLHLLVLYLQPVIGPQRRLQREFLGARGKQFLHTICLSFYVHLGTISTSASSPAHSLGNTGFFSSLPLRRTGLKSASFWLHQK